jgi:superfamily II DNA/RNA helicase
MSTFESLNVKPELVSALKEDGIVNPTTIQEKAIPLLHEGKDLIGISRTGSGKTASFGIPLLERMQPRKGIQGLVLAPTRELAVQISQQLQKWSKNLNLKIATVYGGVGIDPQAHAMTKSEVVVGTPGRLLDHLSRGNLDLRNLNCFILDEADKMVEMGFIEDVEKILSEAPDSRQILLFGATISNEIDYLKKRYMKNAVVAEAELHVKKDLLEQHYYDVKTHEKFSLLVHLLNKEETGRVIIFCSKRSTVELVNSNLRDHGIKAEMIHGKMRQNKRLHVIERFNKGKVDYLIASAVAARGLDIKDVTHVFNYDLSRDPQEYIHRVGRTARAGESGKAITLLSDQDHDAFHQILNRYRMDIQELPLEKFPKLQFKTRPSGDRDGGRFGGRRNFGGRLRNGQGRNGAGRGGYSGGSRRDNDSNGQNRSRNGFSGRNGPRKDNDSNGQNRSFGRSKPKPSGSWRRR